MADRRPLTIAPVLIDTNCDHLLWRTLMRRLARPLVSFFLVIAAALIVSGYAYADEVSLKMATG